MASYTIVLQGVENQGPGKQLNRMLSNLRNLDKIMDELTDEVVLPILGEHFATSGIQSHSEVMKNAVTKRGAAGNIIQKSPGHLMVGVDVAQFPYFKWVLEGRGPVLPVNGKVLRWYDASGKAVFSKRAGPAPAHPVYYLTMSDLQRLEHALNLKVAWTRGN
jgi:hypothetical protein